MVCSRFAGFAEPMPDEAPVTRYADTLRGRQVAPKPATASIVRMQSSSPPPARQLFRQSSLPPQRQQPVAEQAPLSPSMPASPPASLAHVWYQYVTPEGYLYFMNAANKVRALLCTDARAGIPAA